MDRLEDLTALAEWMRAHGVRRLRSGEIELEFAREPVPVGEPRQSKPKTDEELAAEAKEKRRERYRRELGFTPSDDILKGLP